MGPPRRAGIDTDRFVSQAFRVTTSGLDSPAELAAALDSEGYLADFGLATAAFLARSMQRPLFLEGEPGVGKTTLAWMMSRVMKAPFWRLQCYGGIDASQALYDWNFPKQILSVRSAMEGEDRATLLTSIYSPDYLVARPILKALQDGPSVLLIDEIDRADDEFEAFLLEVLENYAITIPELGSIKANIPPFVILTSNRTREVHDALKRRCIYHWISHPDLEREIAIVQRQTQPHVSEALARDVAALMRRLRTHALDLLKPPGIAEAIDAAQAVLKLGEARLDARVAEEILGTFVKHHEDLERVRQDLPTLLATPDPAQGAA